MIEALCEVVKNNYEYVNLSIGFTKVTDWCIIIEERICIGESRKIISVNDTDLNRACAEAYLKLTEWLCENKGGY